MNGPQKHCNDCWGWGILHIFPWHLLKKESDVVHYFYAKVIGNPCISCTCANESRPLSAYWEAIKTWTRHLNVVSREEIVWGIENYLNRSKLVFFFNLLEAYWNVICYKLTRSCIIDIAFSSNLLNMSRPFSQQMQSTYM